MFHLNSVPLSSTDAVVAGEEDNTITKDGDIQITPFNMKEEMTEGHFDTEGNYFWKKETVIRDAWLDNIDDTKVKGGIYEGFS